ncbi:MAG TPA: 30S ribosomal protein S3, partial [Bacillota bacterium]|nr:30S ribosomal protein S3 [Bacillota bacterium]
MGQKVNPIGLRLGINRTWESTWYSDKNYAELLHEDLKLRKYIKNRLYAASVSRIQIERAANRIRVTIHTARPGMVIGRGGSEADALRRDLEAMTGKQVSV